MGCKIVFTPQSLSDLEEIVAFIARNNPDRALTFGNELIDKALLAVDFPELGRVVQEIGNPMVREMIHGSYRIIYEILPDQEAIYVLRFWHGARGEPEVKPRL
jgi:toxin ParE1/3/4